MIESTPGVLEYDKVKDILARMTATEPGKELALALSPLSRLEDVRVALGEVTEMVSLLEDHGSPPVGGCRDIRESLLLLRAEGTWLAAEAFLDIHSSIEAARDCRSYFCGKEEAPGLAARAESLQVFKELARLISRSIGPRAEILDSASFALGDIRQEIRSLRGRIKRDLEGMLSSESLSGVFQDRIITERSGRYVVPVKADHRGRVKGFVHDESSSGQTLYVEPASVLKANNELLGKLREEKREEERILRRLSEDVRVEAHGLRSNQEVLAHLDFRAAAGRFSRLSEGTAPKLSKKPSIDLKGARHPLLIFNADGSLSESKAVPVDLFLGEGKEALVISGPNTGGKSVSLKTVGLSLLMVKSGLHVPCRPGSRIYPFNRVFADIGDQQSIEESLSTFSGHLTRVARILKEADRNSLVLLDEAGTGTDPAEGAALALSVIDSLRQRGTRTIVTTHLNLIKAYAYQEERVENAAVEFDEETFAPTYRIHYGIPGASGAFNIARSYGLPGEVLEGAKRYLGGSELDGVELIEKLNRQRLELEKELFETARLKEEAKKEREKRRKLLKEFEEQKKSLREKALRKADGLVRDAERKVKTILKEARKSGEDVHKRTEISEGFKEVRKKLEPLRAEPVREGRTPSEVEVGEMLRITALGTEGEVVKILPGQVELSVGGKKLRLALEKLEQFSPRRFAKKQKAKTSLKSAVERDSLETRLMLVGKRVDDALPMLERFIDDALLHGQVELEVVHGSGEGILRRAVREFLAGHREVTSFHAADPAQGGDNVTLLRLRSS